MRFVCLAFLACVLAGAGSARAEPSTTLTNIRYPIDFTIEQNPCAGLQETIVLTGYVHLITQVRTFDDGTQLITVHSNWEGASGVGQVSGERYNIVSTYFERYVYPDVPNTDYTFVTNLIINGQGPGNSAMGKQVVHIEFNANGEPTTVVTNIFGHCTP